jgi:hypothetical protein
VAGSSRVTVVAPRVEARHSSGERSVVQGGLNGAVHNATANVLRVLQQSSFGVGAAAAAAAAPVIPLHSTAQAAAAQKAKRATLEATVGLMSAARMEQAGDARDEDADLWQSAGMAWRSRHFVRAMRHVDICRDRPTAVANAPHNQRHTASLQPPATWASTLVRGAWSQRSPAQHAAHRTAAAAAAARRHHNKRHTYHHHRQVRCCPPLRESAPLPPVALHCADLLAS